MRFHLHRCLLVSGLALVTIACPGSQPQPDPGTDVIVQSVSVVPVRVQAFPGTSFEMRALPRDDKGYLVPEFLRDPVSGDVVKRDDYKVEWQIEGGIAQTKPVLTPQGENYHRVKVAIPPYAANQAQAVGANTGPDSTHYDLVAEINGKKARARIAVLLRPDALQGDRIEADDPAGRRPTMALADAGDGSSTLLSPPADCAIADSLIAFAGLAIAGDLYSTGCHKLTQLDVDRRARKDEGVDWGDGSDEVLDGTATQGRLPVPVALWLVDDQTMSASDAFVLMKADADLADLLFSENRVGLAIEVVHSGLLPSDFNDVMLQIRNGGDVFYCSFLRAKIKEFAEKPVNKIDWFDKYVVHVFYIPGARLSYLRGQACASDDGQHGAVLIYMGLRLPTLLAHELGHVLGLIVPQHYSSPEDSLIAEGGVDAINLLAQGPNVLSGGTNAWAGASRSWLTVGQAFWMNWYSLSFLKNARQGPDYSDASSLLLPPPGASSGCSGVVGDRCPGHHVGTTP